ncbi:low-density lipoprotein receptor domain class A domain-containing protein [Phthorimaea operculella]|nr:low-density lipoprotein receptor domain class A domain-containing protein [Phthorimaea operculella]
MGRLSQVAYAFAIALFLLGVVQGKHVKRSIPNVKCHENGRFYRNPERPEDKTWTVEECAKYYLCLEGDVFEFRCSQGLLFDVNRQLCDMQQNVHNCDLTAETLVPRPLLDKAPCANETHLGCANGECLPAEYFCDGSLDCMDNSDERRWSRGHCWTRVPRPLLDKAPCANETHLGCGNGECLPAEYFCDGSLDCMDNSDERGSEATAAQGRPIWGAPTENVFQLNTSATDRWTAWTILMKPLLDKAPCANETHLGCANGECLPAEYFCDGSLDCMDNSDEVSIQ